MRRTAVLIATLVAVALPASALPVGVWLAEGGLAAVGATGGAFVAITAIAQITPQLDSRFAKTAVVIGGLVGGFLSAFTEPILYTLGVPEGITEFVGFLMIPILPAIAATIGYNR